MLVFALLLVFILFCIVFVLFQLTASIVSSVDWEKDETVSKFASLFFCFSFVPLLFAYFPRTEIYFAQYLAYAVAVIICYLVYKIFSKIFRGLISIKLFLVFILISMMLGMLAAEFHREATITDPFLKYNTWKYTDEFRFVYALSSMSFFFLMIIAYTKLKSRR